MSKLGYKTKAYLFQLIGSIVLILLSLIALAFNIWETVASVSIAAILGFVYLFLIMKSSKYISSNTSTSSMGKFLLFTFLRLVVAAIGIISSALIIKLTDDGNKWRYLNVIAATLPFLFVNFTLSLIKGELTKDGE